MELEILSIHAWSDIGEVKFLLCSHKAYFLWDWDDKEYMILVSWNDDIFVQDHEKKNDERKYSTYFILNVNSNKDYKWNSFITWMLNLIFRV